MIRIAVCEDERPARDMLCEQLKEWKWEIALSAYASPEELLSGEPFDLLFLDIRMPGEMDGMELAKRLREKWGREPLIIFVTGFEQYVYEAFDVEAFAYLLKPVKPARLREVCDRAVMRLQNQEKNVRQSFIVRMGSAVREVRIAELRYVEGAGHKIILHLHNERLEYYAKLGELEHLLCERFFRIHKGYLVNLSEVEAYNRTEVTLVGGVRLPLSRYKYEAFAKAYLNYLRGEAGH